MKRTLEIILITFIVFLCNGCGASKESKPNFEVLDSKVNYIVIKDKKIYVTRNFKDFTLQFKGLGCLVNGEYQEKKEIDDIDENDSVLIESARTNYITCYNTDERKWNEEIRVTMHTNTEDQGDINEIYWFQFGSSSQGPFDLHINNKTLLFDGDTLRTPSTSEDLIQILGNNFEEDSGTFSKYYKYKDDSFTYSFGINEKSKQLHSFILDISR